MTQEPVTSNIPTQIPTPKRRISTPLLVAVALLLTAAVSYFFGRRAAVPPPAAPTEAVAEKKADALLHLSPKARKTAGIAVTPARRSSFGVSLLVPGTVQAAPRGEARVTTPVSGRLVALYAAPGDAVRAGQRVALLDSPEVALAHAAIRDAQSRLAESQADVQTVSAAVTQAQTKASSAASALARQRELARTGALTQPSLQLAQNAFNDAQADVAAARTELSTLTAAARRTARLFAAQVSSQAENEQAQAAQSQAETRVIQAQAREKLARQTLTREQTVFRGGLLARQATQRDEADVRAAAGDVSQARTLEQAARTRQAGARNTLSAARASLQTLEASGHVEGGAGRVALFAPLTGTVAERSATVGQAVERSSALLTIQNLDSVLVEADIPEAQAARVRVGASVVVSVAAYPDVRFSGVVQSVGSQIEEKTRALPVRCRVPNPDRRLRPGMFARVVLAADSRTSAVSVSDDALDEDGDVRFVYVQKSDGFEKRKVQIGRRSGGRTEIVSGLTAGERVVTNGLFVLKSESKKDELKGDD